MLCTFHHNKFLEKMRVRQGAGLLATAELQLGEHIKGHPDLAARQLAVPRNHREEGGVLCQPILTHPGPHLDVSSDKEEQPFQHDARSGKGWKQN